MRRAAPRRHCVAGSRSPPDRPPAAGLGAEARDRVVDTRALAELEHERATGGAKSLVDTREHPPKAVGAVRREQSKALRLLPGAERLQRALERLAAEHRRTRILELPKPRIEPGGERVRTQQPVAEAVDRRDPGAVELAREIGTTALAERGPDARSELARRFPRVRDHEDGVDVDPAIADGTDVALDEHRRLPRTGTRRDEHRPLGLDRGDLLLVEHRLGLDDRHALGTRHMGQRSHQAGQPSPLGSWRTSPLRIRPALSAARSRAASTCAQNVSSSR